MEDPFSSGFLLLWCSRSALAETGMVIGPETHTILCCRTAKKETQKYPLIHGTKDTEMVKKRCQWAGLWDTSVKCEEIHQKGVRCNQCMETRGPCLRGHHNLELGQRQRTQKAHNSFTTTFEKMEAHKVRQANNKASTALRMTSNW